MRLNVHFKLFAFCAMKRVQVCSIKLQNVKECDARGADSSNGVGIKIKIPHLRTFKTLSLSSCPAYKGHAGG
jgi:hypothetical protein